MGWKNKAVFDIAEALDTNDNIGAFLRDALGNLLTSQLNGAQQALDVGINVAGVQIDPRQIRALTNADVVTAEQGTSPWVVSATDLDIRDLTQADEVTVFQGTDPWIVAATDLDIRDLDAAQDSVQAWAHDGTGTAITSTVVGADTGLDVNILNSLTVDINGVYNVGTNPDPDNVGMIAHVRSAAPGDADQTFRSTGAAASSDAVVAANVQGLDVNAFGMSYNGTTWDRNRSRNNELLVNDTANSAILQTQKNVTTTTGALLVTQLANRKYMLIQNAGSGTVYLGAAGVSAADGFPISGGSVAELRCGPAVSVHAVTNTGTRDTRILELS